MLPKVSDTGAIQTKYYVVIKSILDGTKVNWVDILVKEMMVCKNGVRGALGFQAYIMALVVSKACP